MRDRRDARGLAGTVLDEHSVFTLHELCHACGVHAELVIEMVDEGCWSPGARCRRSGGSRAVR